MAPGLKWWLGGIVLGCTVIAAAYLPARGMGALPDIIGGSFRRMAEPTRSAIAERRSMLAERYKVMDAQIQAAELRRQAEPILEQRRTEGLPPYAAVFSGDSTLEERRRTMGPALDSAWRQLELEDAKVALVLASPGRREHAADTPPVYGWWKTYILPDSTDRTTCVVVYPSALINNEKPRQSVMEQRMRVGLGPCAFYARFGVPSPRVRRWLQANRFDVTESSDWSDIQRYRDQWFEEDPWRNYIGVGSIWYYTTIYSQSFNTVGCLAGRVPACLTGLRAGDRDDGTPLYRVVTPAERWRFEEQRLPEVATLLAAIVRQVGEDRFQEFWTTALPIDSALSIALEQPAGEWLATRKLSHQDKLQLGPIPPWPTMVIPVLVAGVMLALAAVAVTYRQVR